MSSLSILEYYKSKANSYKWLVEKIKRLPIGWPIAPSDQSCIFRNMSISKRQYILFFCIKETEMRLVIKEEMCSTLYNLAKDYDLSDFVNSNQTVSIPIVYTDPTPIQTSSFS